LRRIAVAAVAAFLVVVPSAGATDFATTALNVLPSGQYGAPGNPNAPKQAELYNSLTPRYDNVTDADLPTFFKSEALEPATVVSTETIPGRPGVQIKRDDFNIPHVYGTTDDDVIFGAGWIAAEDRGLLLAQARYNGLTAAIDAPNLSAINLISGLYSFAPSAQTNKIVDKQTDEILKAGPRGKQLLDDIDTYLEGINAWYAANSPSTAKFTRIDLYAINAVKAQFLGQGGGDEVNSSMFLNGLQKRLGDAKGLAAWTDLRNRKDPEAPVTVAKAAPYDTATGSLDGTVTLQNGSFKKQGGLPAGSRAASTERNEASNILMVAGSRSATGKPLFVGGPQISYFFPGLVYEIGLHGPSIDVRGATSAPFPGYMLIGRGEDYAWTLTSAGGDIIDTWAETLCGGSKVKYLYKGKCLAMEKVSAGTLTKAPGFKQEVTFYRTVHGSVTGYAKTTAGKTVAIARQRSSYGKDTVDQLFFQQMTFGRVKSFKDFTAAAALTPQTFNSFYADEKEAGVFTSGLLPLRRKGSDGSLVNDGRGAFDWAPKFLSAKAHPQGSVTTGTVINWNNRPAPGFVAGDDRFGSEGPLQRVDMLNGEIARTKKHTLGSVVAAMNVAAVGDVRGYSFWPTMRAMLAKGKAPSARAKTMVDLVDKWSKARAPRLDKDRDGKLDDPGVPILDGIWDGVANAALCGPVGTALCNQLDGLQSRFAAPPGGQYDGWYHYMSKDFRTLLGQKPKGAFSRTYCAATAAACAAKLWKAIDAAGGKLAAKLGADPAAWRAARLEIKFVPLPLISMDYTNRPSGIQQVISFTGHR
jgi:acyl-homoserine lactone acylase PvdQ